MSCQPPATCSAKNITNKPRINEDPKDAMLREFQDEIAKLKAQLAAKQGTGGATVGSEVEVSFNTLCRVTARVDAYGVTAL